MSLNKKLVFLIRRWLHIENKEHRHWCNYVGRTDAERCYHTSVCWYCTDPFCADVERKDCPNCEAGNLKVCKGKIGQYGPCTCGYGRD